MESFWIEIFPCFKASVVLNNIIFINGVNRNKSPTHFQVYNNSHVVDFSKTRVKVWGKYQTLPNQCSNICILCKFLGNFTSHLGSNHPTIKYMTKERYYIAMYRIFDATNYWNWSSVPGLSKSGVNKRPL